MKNMLQKVNQNYQFLSLYALTNQSISIAQAQSDQQKTSNLVYQLKVFARLSTALAAIASTVDSEVTFWLAPAFGVISAVLDIKSAVLSTIALTQYV